MLTNTLAAATIAAARGYERSSGKSQEVVDQSQFFILSKVAEAFNNLAEAFNK